MSLINCTFWSAGPAGGQCANPDATTTAGASPGPRPGLTVCERFCLSRVPVDPDQPARSGGQFVPLTIKRKPRRSPLALRVLAKLARPEDRGAGDTVARIVGPLGGEAFKVWYKRLTGSDCWCENMQQKLNALFPYGRLVTAPSARAALPSTGR